MDQLLQERYPANEPGAAVLVAQNGKVILRQGYGLADLATHTPMTPDREFRVASISKQFTAVAVLQLVADGRIGLDDPVARYLPDLFGGRDWGITVRELLAHTSGLKNYSDVDAFRDQPTRAMSTAFLWDLVKGYGVAFSPGTRWEYCNTGYMLLGALVERVTGQAFGRYLRQNVLERAGLANTRYGAGLDGRTAATAGVTGYSRSEDAPEAEFEPAVVLNLTQANAAGGLITRVDDLWKWEQAVEGGQVLAPNWVRLARSPAALEPARTQIAKGARLRGAKAAFGDAGANAPYGLGWEIGTSSGLDTIGHGGTMCGYRSYEVEVPAARLYVVILCNCDHPRNDPADVADEIIAKLAP
jgi:CubicO group peptidase (beta-lactamase class C family)